MNKVILMGRLVKKETKQIGKKGNEHILSNICIAVDKFVNGENKAEFYNITLWDKKADFVEKYVEKGKRILIEGFLAIENYTDKDGKNHNITKIIGEKVEFADGKSAKTEETTDELPF
jgi:single-strand DNA-binding protein